MYELQRLTYTGYPQSRHCNPSSGAKEHNGYWLFVKQILTHHQLYILSVGHLRILAGTHNVPRCTEHFGRIAHPGSDLKGWDHEKNGLLSSIHSWEFTITHATFHALLHLQL